MRVELESEEFGWKMIYEGLANVNLSPEQIEIVRNTFRLVGTALASAREFETSPSRAAYLEMLYRSMYDAASAAVSSLQRLRGQEILQQPLRGKYHPDHVFGKGVFKIGRD